VYLFRVWQPLLAHLFVHLDLTVFIPLDLVTLIEIFVMAILIYFQAALLYLLVILYQ